MATTDPTSQWWNTAQRLWANCEVSLREQWSDLLSRRRQDRRKFDVASFGVEYDGTHPYLRVHAGLAGFHLSVETKVRRSTKPSVRLRQAAASARAAGENLVRRID